jgi:galactose mutarotase-like enzyme
MPQTPSIDERWTFLSHKAVILENKTLRITVLPELGARIWSVIYKPLDRELIWQNSRIPPRRVQHGSAFDNFWCGGWEEMFPTVAPATIHGESYPDHGEVWSLAWTGSSERGRDSVTLRLNCHTPISGLAVEKALTLRGDMAAFDVRYTIKNPGNNEALPFLFALHPAMAVSEGYRIDFPDMQFELDPSFPGTLAGIESPFRWPLANGNTGEVDLRVVKPASSKQLYMLYGYGHREGWVAITDPASKLTAGLTFSPEFFQSCWMFAPYGGWRGYHDVVLVEPCTSYPARLEEVIQNGRVRSLEPGAVTATTVRFLVQEGLSSVGGLTETGLFRE